MIHVIAAIQAEPGKRSEVLAEFHKLVPQVLAEDGCIEYGPAVDFDSGAPMQAKSGEDVFTVIEKWESMEHLTAHLAATHMVEYRETVKDLVTGVTLHILEPA